MYRRRRNDSTDPSRAEVAIPFGCEYANPDMSNSRGEERRRRSDMPGSQAVRVVFRSRPWSGTARAATPPTLRAGSGSRVRTIVTATPFLQGGRPERTGLLVS